MCCVRAGFDDLQRATAEDWVPSGVTAHVREKKAGPLPERETVSARPVSVADLLEPEVETQHLRRAGETEVELIVREERKGRFGPEFGDTVHYALQIVLENRTSPEIAAEPAISACKLAHHQAEVLSDVRRTFLGLRDGGLLEDTLRLARRCTARSYGWTSSVRCG